MPSFGLSFRELIMALKGKPIAIGTSDTTIYTCPSTLEASVHGLVFSNNNLDSTALDEIYTNASATGAGKTITVTGNWGAANDTPSIATAKGWAVTG